MNKLNLIKLILKTPPEVDEKILSIIQAFSAGQSPVQVENAIEIDEREHKRKPLVVDVTIEGESAKTGDLSFGGAHLKTSKSFVLNDHITIYLSSDNGGIPFEAEVVRLADDGIGVRILDISPDNRARLSNLLNK